jgi:hypothetical protein
MNNMNLEMFSYVGNVYTHIPNYNILDDYKDSTESVMKGSMDFRKTQLKSYGYFTKMKNVMIIDMDYKEQIILHFGLMSDDNTPHTVNISDLKALIRDSKLKKLLTYE